MSRTSYIIGSGPAVVRKFILSEGADFTVPPNSTVLYSEVVSDSEGTELLEVWIAAPTSSTQESATQVPSEVVGPTTIYTKTVVHEDDPDTYTPQELRDGDFDPYAEDFEDENYEDDGEFYYD